MKNLLLKFTLCLYFIDAISIQAQDSIKYLSILSPSHLAGIYYRDSSDFSLTDGWGGKISGNILIGNGKIPNSDEELCKLDGSDLTGFIAIIRRGLCEFSAKAFNAQKSGAIAVIIVNFDNTVVPMAAGSLGNQVTIPVFMVTSELGEILIEALKNTEDVTLSIGSSPGKFGTINGFINRDLNLNCISDTSDTFLPYWTIKVKDKNNNLSEMKTDALGFYKGHFSQLLEPYSLSVPTPNFAWTSCTSYRDILIPVYDTTRLDFAVKSNKDCVELHTEISATRLRSCFESDFFVLVSNKGTTLAKNCYLDVGLAKEFDTINDASANYIIIRPNLYRFQLGDLKINQDTSIYFNTKVKCDSVMLNQTLCYFAQAYPDTSCNDVSSLWSRADIKVFGDCIGNFVEFKIQNIGIGDMTEKGNYIIIKDDKLYKSSSFQLIAGQSNRIEVPADGSTWHLEATQEPNHPNPSILSKTVEACTRNGNFTTGYAMMFPLSDLGFSFDEECQEVIGSYDPNDKEGFPKGYGSSNYIKPNTEIEYIIRFQNTGTDTAYSVVIKDILPSSLDVNSIHSIISSHPYLLEIISKNQLLFKFKNIKLVDSFTNERLSHGFVSFKIKQTPDNPFGTSIENTASIYFDHNAGVVTFPTYHEVGDVISVVATQGFEKEKNLLIYPNPAFKYFNVLYEAKCKLELISYSGKIIDNFSYNIPNSLGTWELNGIPAGLYFVKVIDNNSNYSYKKIIIY